MKGNQSEVSTEKSQYRRTRPVADSNRNKIDQRIDEKELNINRTLQKAQTHRVSTSPSSGRAPAQQSENEISQSLPIPEYKMGWIVGKGGSYINQLSRKSGAALTISESTSKEYGTVWKYVQIKGTGRAVDRAKKLLHIRLERLEPRSDVAEKTLDDADLGEEVDYLPSASSDAEGLKGEGRKRSGSSGAERAGNGEGGGEGESGGDKVGHESDCAAPDGEKEKAREHPDERVCF